MSEDLKDKNEDSAKPKIGYPKAIYFILGNEFCERFAYFGIHAVLCIYLTKELEYDDNLATTIYHSWTLIAYFTPLFGAILADSWFGKFRTILYISIICAIGNVMTSIGSIPNRLQTMKIVTFAGLLIVTCCTGAIKSCNIAFGGDQFSDDQLGERTAFFSIFYFMINLGSLLACLFIPILRKRVMCMGSITCYPLAFGVPAVLMVLSIIIFFLGKTRYKNRIPKQNSLLMFLCCISHATVQRLGHKEKDKEHWLDYADDKYDRSFITDAKYVLRIWLIMIPLPLFWTLFDQQCSRWTLQATKLNGYIYGFEILPDQMVVLNSAFVLLFIPLFNCLVYPGLHKLNWLNTPLQRVTAGGMCAALSFLIAGLLEVAIEENRSNSLTEGLGLTNIVNISSCIVNITDPNDTNFSEFQVKFIETVTMKANHWKFLSSNCIEKDIIEEALNDIESIDLKSIVIIEDKFKSVKNNGMKATSINNEFISILLTKVVKKFSLIILNKNTFYIFPPSDNIYIVGNRTAKFAKSNYSRLQLDLYEISQPSSRPISMLYQIPQYVMITAGEVMFSISGLEFTYSQAPISMKSVVQASWLFTIGIGNLIIVIIIKSEIFHKQSWEFFAYAIAMFIDMILLSVIALFYEYVTIRESTANVEFE